MRWLLLFCLLLSGLGLAKTEEIRLFQPADRTFRVFVPGNPRSISQDSNKFLWGVDDGRTSYVFGYTVLPRAAGMEEEDLRAGLGQYATGYLRNAQVREKSRTPVKVGAHVGLDVRGTASYGDSWVRILAVGPRIYVLASDGTTEAETTRYWTSFKLLSN